MNSKHRTWLTALALAIAVSMTLVPASAQNKYRTTEEIWGSKYGYTSYKFHVRADKASGLAGLRRWNQISIDASGLDHTPVAPGENRVFGEQLGPCRAARAVALVNMAMFEALNAIVPRYQSMVGMYPYKKANRDVAVAQAAHDTLVVVFPSQKALFDTRLATDLAAVPNNAKKTAAIQIGRTAALAVLGLCYNDKSNHAEPRINVDYIPGDAPGIWRQDPISLIPLALGAQWNTVRPLVLESADQFRLPAPPALDSAEYATAYNEVKDFGGDGVVTPTVRTQDQTDAGLFWAYDGTPSLCAPPRLYNQITIQICDQRGLNDIDTARVLALVNLGLAEAGITSWDSKFHWNFWRPVGGIREADAGTGPTGLGDNNPATAGDATYTPLGAPASNLNGPNFTPPFPAYPSGHATFGGALFETLRNVFGTDNISFTFVSDELNGETLDNEGVVRPLKPRTFNTLSQAEIENGQSRIYLGIHWSFDASGGITQGHQVADYLFTRVYQPK
ncbi:MAG: vanadium-dependent haloperoxidase [Acidobacteria bacterium]|nr:vanadium-dependent haloperoxidase [Acidobacteriota bacterium]